MAANTQPEPLPEALPDGILDDSGWAHYGCTWNAAESYYDFVVAKKPGCNDIVGGAIEPFEIDWEHYGELVAEPRRDG